MIPDERDAVINLLYPTNYDTRGLGRIQAKNAFSNYESSALPLSYSGIPLWNRELGQRPDSADS